MCTLVFAWDSHPRYRFVFAGNRDEFHDRPTECADWWAESPILAGRDLEAGGTWLAVDRSGRFAVVTNFREGRPPGAGNKSRGELITDFLKSDDCDLFRERLDARTDAYSGYNLIYGDLRNALYYHSNRGHSGGINPGLHGISNHLLDTPWPKVNRASAGLTELLAQPVIQTEQLLDILEQRQPADDSELPDTGVGVEMEKLLSSIFIVSPGYGTRCSTVMLLDRDGLLQFVERRFDPDGSVAGESHFEFQLQ